MVLQFFNDKVREVSLVTVFNLVVSVDMELGEAKTRGVRYRVAAMVVLFGLCYTPTPANLN